MLRGISNKISSRFGKNVSIADLAIRANFIRNLNEGLLSEIDFDIIIQDSTLVKDISELSEFKNLAERKVEDVKKNRLDKIQAQKDLNEFFGFH